MNWIHRFDLFLFDFDGLLVDTEGLHLKAYQEMCRRRGYHLPWTMEQYFAVAHSDAGGIRKAFYELYPGLLQKEPRWEVLYAEKKAIYEKLLEDGDLTLLPGVRPLLEKLAQLNKKRCVVTNSAYVQAELIKAQIPVLQTIPRWFTRETYQKPKPAPDGYLAALAELQSKGDRVIGFEDSMRGYQSLQDAGVATPILICPPSHPQLQLPAQGKRLYVPSFKELDQILSS